MQTPSTQPLADSDPATLTVETTAFVSGGPIPTKYAFGQPDGNGQSKPGGNINPQLSWSGIPAEAKSLALIVVDPDVPAKFDDANQPGKTIAKDFPRQNFYHWVLYDIPVSIIAIEEGSQSNGITEGGKPLGKTDIGITGPNDYGPTHGGYDGPCPPWNDVRLHHYHFRIYALDVPTLNLTNPSDGRAVEQAMQGHILAWGEIVGTYTQYAPLLK